MKAIELQDGLFYVGVNDRQKTLFENMLPLPKGVSYNSYLIVDEKVLLVDTVEAPFTDQLISKIQSVLGDRVVDYLLVNHMEPDHSSGIRALKAIYPDVQIIGNVKTKGMLEGYYGLNENIYEVKDGDVLSLGSRELTFYMTPMVHWPEVMMAYDAKNEILFSADAFGCFGTLDGAVKDVDLHYKHYLSEMHRYYVNIVGKYGGPVQSTLKKFAGAPLKMICSTHGPVWTKHIPEIVGIYDKLSKYEPKPGVVIAYGTMYGNTAEMAEAVARGAHEITKDVQLFDVSRADQSEVLSQIFQYKGLILGAPTYCNSIFPPLKTLMDKIEIRTIKNRVFAGFGSFTWAGVMPKKLKCFAESMKWEEPSIVEVKQSMNNITEEQLMELGRELARKAID